MSKLNNDMKKLRIEGSREKLKIEYENIDTVIANLLEVSTEISEIIKKKNKEIKDSDDKARYDMLVMVKARLSEYDSDYKESDSVIKYENLVLDNEKACEESLKVITDELGRLYTLSHSLKQNYKELGKEHE